MVSFEKEQSDRRLSGGKTVAVQLIVAERGVGRRCRKKKVLEINQGKSGEASAIRTFFEKKKSKLDVAAEFSDRGEGASKIR